MAMTVVAVNQLPKNQMDEITKKCQSVSLTSKLKCTTKSQNFTCAYYCKVNDFTHETVKNVSFGTLKTFHYSPRPKKGPTVCWNALSVLFEWFLKLFWRLPGVSTKKSNHPRFGEVAGRGRNIWMRVGLRVRQKSLSASQGTDNRSRVSNQLFRFVIQVH